MKNFGNTIFILFLYLIFANYSIFGNEVEFKLSSATVSLGEVIFLDVKHDGQKELKPIERKFESDNIQVYYIGDSFETQIINFTVTKKHVLKYQVAGKRTGKFKIPKIRIQLDNQIIESDELLIEVTPKNNSRPQGIFDQFFGDQRDEVTISKPSEVVFHTNKNVCFVGEPIVGYYVLYSNGLRQPFLERDPNQSISFPFFLSEVLNQVTIQIDPVVNRNGTDRNTLVYLKEIYGLTPLRVGTYSIGSTNFIVGDSMRFGFTNEVLPVNTGKIQVLPLPKGAPNFFSGAIGEYDISFHAKPTQIHLGETYYFSIRVFGSGAGIGIEDPLELTHTNSDHEFYLLKKEKSKVFRKLPEGEFGFYSVVEFFYSFQSILEGKREFQNPKISYFSPKNNAYETKKTTIPPLLVLPKRLRQKSNQTEEQPSELWRKNYLFWILFGILMVTGISFLTQRMITNNQIRIQLEKLNGKIGTKKGEILRDYLVRHGISEKEASSLAELSIAFPTMSWEKIYDYSNQKDKQMLISICKHLNN
jgi:hypothetical protein